MPGRNGMGPGGMGARTGRAAGPCAGAGGSELAGRGRGQGSGMECGGGRGGRGWRWIFRATGLTGWQRGLMGWPGAGAASPPGVSKEQELSALKQRTTDLQQALGELNARIRGLEKPAPDAARPGNGTE
jgi:hypothetical protein